MAEKKRSIGSDLKAVDTYKLRQDDYDEIPELTKADFARGVWHRGGKPMPHGPRGRPKSKTPKLPVSLRLDPDVVAHFRLPNPSPATLLHILNTPNFVSGIGALSVAANDSASTRRVSAGVIIPSSQSRAVA